MADLGQRVSSLEARADNLEGWQRTQNGTLQRLDEKIDRNLKWSIATALSAGLAVISLLASLIMGMWPG